MSKTVITSNAATVNKTYDVHQIDLNHSSVGSYDPQDEVVFEVEGASVDIFFKNGGHLVQETNADLGASILKNKDRLEIYQ